MAKGLILQYLWEKVLLNYLGNYKCAAQNDV